MPQLEVRSPLVFSLLLLAASALAANAQTPAAVPYKPDNAKPATITLTTPVVEVPLLLLGNPPRVFPVVEAYVNGRGPYRIAIETGAEFATVTPKLAAELGLKRIGGNDEFPEYHLDSVNVGGAVFRSFTAAGLRTSATDIDGLFGLPVYSDLLLTIDYLGKKVRFERGALPAADGQTVLSLTKGRNGHFWRLPMEIQGKTFMTVLDTRSSGTFGLTPEFVAAEKIAFDGELAVVGMASGAAIAPVEVKAGYLASDVKIGRYTFPRPQASVRPLPPGFPIEPLVGTQLLQYFVMTLDQKNARLRLERTGPATIELPRMASQPVRQTVSQPASGAAIPQGATRVRIDPADYVGTWGDRTVTFEGNEFFLQRPNGAKHMLVATGLDSFGIKDVPAAQYKFVRDSAGKVVELQSRNQDGAWEKATRSPAQQ